MSITGLAQPRSVPAFFTTPSAGRRIHVGFSHLQRIGKGATTDVWFSDFFRSLPDTPIEWGAIRQFELLQEAGNLAIEDLDVTDTRRAFQSMMKMRGGGYRVTQITLGDYTDEPERDDLALFDQKLQEEIAQLINFLYLSEMSEQANEGNHTALQSGSWSLASAIPHITRTLGARRLFRPERETLAEKTFFELLEKIPASHIVHDTAIGLVLPDATKEKNWCYIAQGENTFAMFQNTMTTVLGGLDRAMATMRHMRGYGDRLGSRFENWGAAPA
jgi:hypothetical protein